MSKVQTRFTYDLIKLNLRPQCLLMAKSRPFLNALKNRLLMTQSGLLSYGFFNNEDVMFSAIFHIALVVTTGITTQAEHLELIREKH